MLLPPLKNLQTLHAVPGLNVYLLDSPAAPYPIAAVPYIVTTSTHGENPHLLFAYMWFRLDVDT